MPTTTFRTCPYCMKELEEKELQYHPLSCGAEEADCENGCGMKMPRWMHQQHKEVICKKRKVECDSCSAMILFNEVEDHKQMCSMEIVECNLMYGFQGERFTASNHMTEHSPASLETCPHCTHAIEKTQMEEHVAKCEEEMSCCDGCGKKVQKDCMDVHMKEYCCKRVKECIFCDTTVVVDTFTEHYEVCELFPVQCEKKCGKKIARRHINDHLHECPKRLVMCEYCGIEVEFELLETHQSDCSKFLVSCSENCGKNISREFLEQHLNEECEKLYGPCDFKEMSCTHEDFPAGMQKHMVENVNRHMKLIGGVIHENEKKVKDQVELLENNVNYLMNLTKDTVEKVEKNADYMEREMQNIHAKITRIQENLEKIGNGQVKYIDEMVKKFEKKLELEKQTIPILKPRPQVEGKIFIPAPQRYH